MNLDLAKLDRLDLQMAGLRAQRDAASETVQHERRNARALQDDLHRRVLVLDRNATTVPQDWLAFTDDDLKAVSMRREDIRQLLQMTTRISALSAHVVALDAQIAPQLALLNACHKFADNQSKARFN